MHKVPHGLKSETSLSLASEEGQIPLCVCAGLQFSLTIFSYIVKQVTTKFIHVFLLRITKMLIMYLV